jgi:hypothetical protein
MSPTAIRQAIQKNSGITIALVVVVGLVAVAWALRNTSFSPPVASTKAYYTVDEGQTVFVEEMSKLPPFQHDGKTAYRVWMFSADGGMTKFPGYLERYTPEAQKRIEAALAAAKPGQPAAPPVGPADTEVKKPGNGNKWVNRANMGAASKVTNVQSSAGAPADLIMP